MQKPLKITSTDKEKLLLAREMLEADLAVLPSIDKLCKHSGLNSDKLKRGFKFLYGNSPRAFQHALRMRESQRLLRITEKTVQEIAWAIGYDSSSGFCKAFRRFTGVTALEWKAQESTTIEKE